MEKKKLILIDGHSIVHRAYYGVPDLTNSRGMHTNAIYGFLNILFKALKEEHPAYLVIAFDEHAPTFRHALFAEYKGTRKPMDPELREQIPVLREILEAMTIPCVSIPTIEADDILGTLALKAASDGLEVDLISGDRDLLQIAREHVRICIPTTTRGQTTTKYYHEKELLEEYHLTPSQFIDRKALMGDSSDNYPGVPKVGEKTAGELIQTYGSLDGVYEHLEEISKNSIRESLRENKDLAYLCRTLATIKTDCEFDFSYESAGTEHLFTPAAYELIKQYELKSFFPYFEESDKVVTAPEKKIVSFDDPKSWAEAAAKAGFPSIGLSFGLEEGTLYGACIAGEREKEAELYYLTTVPGKENEVADALSAILTEGLQVAVCDVKDSYGILGLDCKADLFDCVIGAYLVNPLKNDYDEESVALEYLQWTVKSRKERYGKRTLQEVAFSNPDTLQEDLCDRALISLKSAPGIRENLKNRGMDRLMNDIEMPLSKVLYDMERIGIRVKRDDLTAFSKELEEGIAVLEKRIYEEAGEEFNIQSPKQLGVILFEKLGLPGGKKTKSGYSTAADVLEKLAGQSPIVLDILEYRGLSKLKSTYADGLPAYIGPDERIHCRFNQTVTATGRISSSEPNLQNIPIRSELGRRLRKVFVAEEGYSLTDADYSQIELRILASLSGDKSLIEAYNSSQDIHRITASKVFGVPFEEVTDLQRRNAKAVNFGIVYGISSFGLSEDLSISKKEAAAYIEQYFATYPGIKSYLDALVEHAKRTGYAETFFGRRRPIPELKASNFMQRSFGERVAMNAPIQGTAADIMKIAMISVWKELRERNLRSKLILQVHDELVIETAAGEEEIVAELLERNMKNAADFAVVLEVGMSRGNTWYDAH